MRLEPRKKQFRPKTSEVLFNVEDNESAPFFALEELFVPLQARNIDEINYFLPSFIEDPKKKSCSAANLTFNLAMAAVLNQVFAVPIFSSDLEHRIQQAIQQSPEYKTLMRRVKNSKSSNETYMFASWAAQAFPDNIQDLKPSDFIVNYLLGEINANGKRNVYEKINLLGALAVLRPDRIPEFRQAFNQCGGPDVWKARMEIIQESSTIALDSLQACRLLFPDLSFTPQEKIQTVNFVKQESKEQDNTLNPDKVGIFAILLAQRVEIQPTGKILVTKPTPKLHHSSELPDRSLV